MISPEKEIEILERISSSEKTIRQRDLARIIGLSLGMTNSILKRLARKGLLQIKKVNNRNIQYVVSPNGMEAIANRSYRYFKRTIRNVAAYKDAMDGLIWEIKNKGYKNLLLIGASDLDFIVEHFCVKYGLNFRSVNQFSPEGHSRDLEFLLYSENVNKKLAEQDNAASLHSLFFKVVALNNRE